MDKDNRIESLVTHLSDMYREAGYSVAADYTADQKGRVGRYVKVYKGDMSVIARLFARGKFIRASVSPTEECLASGEARLKKRRTVMAFFFGEWPSPLEDIGNLVDGLLPEGLYWKSRRLADSIRQAIEDFASPNVTIARGGIH